MTVVFLLLLFLGILVLILDRDFRETFSAILVVLTRSGGDPDVDPKAELLAVDLGRSA